MAKNYTNAAVPIAPEETRNAPVATAPRWSDVYDRESSQLVEAKAISYRNQVNPGIIHIASSNVLVDQTTEAHPQYTSVTTTPYVVVTEPQPQTQRTFRGRPVKAKNAGLSDDILAFKEHRKAQTAASTWAGGIIGFIFLGGPVGAGIAAGVAYGVSKSTGKAKERRLIQQYEATQAPTNH